MIVQIKTRDDNGKFRNAYAGEFAEAAIRHIILWWGFAFLILWLGKVCLKRAEESHNHAEADIWIERYRAIREIK